MAENYGLTFPQKNIWNVEKYYGNTELNNIVGLLYIKYAFDRVSCEKAVNELVKNNDALRLQMSAENENVFQYVKDYEPFDVDFFDISDGSKTEQELNKELIKTPFILENSALYYFAIVRTTNDAGYIYVKMHHLVSDAWSCSKIAESLSAILLKDVEPEINESYINFIEAEKDYSLSEKFEADRVYWKEYLSGFEETVTLKERAKLQDNNAKRYTVKLSDQLNDIVKNYSKANRVSPFAIFVNALAIYIHRVTGKNDLIIGTPILNRANAKEKKILGMFVSTMPLRFKLDEKMMFSELLKLTGIETLKSFRHQKYPYSLMLEEFKKSNDFKNNLYSVMFSYQNARFDNENEERFSTGWVFNGKIQNELEVHVMDMDETGTLTVHFDYLTSLFADVEIEYLAKRIFAIIEDGLTKDKTIENIEIMSKEEKDKILYEFNDTKMDYPKDKSVLDIFEEQVDKNPEKVAVVFEDEKLTYSQLNEQANGIAATLQKSGVKQGQAVGIYIDKSPELIFSIIGTLKAGAYYIPLEKTYNDERKKFMLSNAGVKLVLVDDYLNVEMPQINVKDVGALKEYKHTARTPDTNNCILYTSGTTGEPKGAIIVDRNITKLVIHPDYIDIKKEDKILQAASTSFDVSLFEIWGALLNSATLVLIKKENLITPSMLKKTLLDNEVTILWITSALFNKMIEANPKMFVKLKRLFTGGDVISIKHVNMLKDACPELVITNCYGPTECVAFTNTFNITQKMIGRIPLGRAISNTAGYVLDSKNRMLPLYVYGEYVIAGESVGNGYINNPGLTSEKFIKNTIDNKFCIDRIYKTGDIVQMLDGGVIDFIGRADNQIKIRGYRIELDEIRIAIQNYGKIKDAVAICRDENEEKQINAYFVSEQAEDIDELVKFLKLKLPPFMVPHKIMQIDAMPINQNGKIDRKKLPNIVEKTKTRSDSSIKDYDGIYKIIYDIFKKITNVQDIGEDDSFFDIGGDSLSVIKIISELSLFNVQVTYQDIYKYSTIKSLGDMISKNYKVKSISSELESLDFTKINELLTKNKLNLDVSVQKNARNVLLIGSTGFLGAHILYEYVRLYKTSKVYCIVRGKGNTSGKERLFERLQFFFGEKVAEELFNNITVVEGDILDHGVIENLSKSVVDDIDIVINSAAYVKHFGKLELFKAINTKSVEVLAEFACNNNKQLIQISTLSVSGNILENGQVEQKNIKPGTIFNENNLYIGQDLDNVYAYSKFLAEKVIYDYIIDKNLNAKVIRMGNLTGRLSDGKFQPNVDENAFAQRLKTIVDLKVVPDNLLDFDIEFTPIDKAAQAVVILASLEKNEYNTFHLFNDNHVKMRQLCKTLNMLKIKLKKIGKTEMTELITGLMNSNYSKLQGITQDLNNKYELEYNSNIKIKEDFTKSVLEKCGFLWPEINEEYLIKYLNELGIRGEK